MNIAVDNDDGTLRLVVVSSKSDARLELRQPDDPTRAVASYDVLLSVSGLQARTSVYFYGDDGLSEYISTLAREWRGWSGRREWSSLEGQLTLDAEHDRLGTIELVAGLTPSAAFDRWHASAVFHIDAGGLDAAVIAVNRFLAASA